MSISPVRNSFQNKVPFNVMSNKARADYANQLGEKVKADMAAGVPFEAANEKSSVLKEGIKNLVSSVKNLSKGKKIGLAAAGAALVAAGAAAIKHIVDIKKAQKEEA